ncbi:MAG: replicative DNA helicase [candidate division Zixibacteria bacterium]|nr:replicative DNA helicase [candidate division Zixibacteria bacterium]
MVERARFGTEAETAERIPPSNLEAERAVLGAMLLDKEAIGRTLEMIDETAFYRPAHQKIFWRMVKLYDANEPVDLTTLSDALAKSGELEEVGGRLYLVSLAEGVATSANVEYHSRIVLEKATLRQLIETGTQVVSSCYDPTAEVDDLLDRAESRIFAISEVRMKQGFVELGSILPHTFESIEEYHRQEGAITGLETGFPEMDALTGGLQPSDLVVVAGRPSMGKTAFVLTLCEHAALHATQPTPVAIFSLEMSKQQVAQRMLCSRARVSWHRMRTGRLANAEWTNLGIAVGPLSEAKIFVDDSPNIGVLEMRAKARRLMSQHQIGLLVIDYMQLMHGPRGAESRQQEISIISRSLKGLAKELDIPVVALSQLSRQVEIRGGDRRPVLADLRESGAIEQDADVVAFIYRPEMYKMERDKEGRSLEGVAEVIVAKQRNGPTGTVRLTFIKEYARFENMATLPEAVPSGGGPAPF